MRAARITGAVLAGGRGTRLDGLDKGLVDIGPRCMVAHVLERFAPQVDTLCINANRNLERYAEFGYPVIPDLFEDYPGPLAGIGAALAHADTGLVACVPCDSPFLPGNLVDKLHEAMLKDGSEVSYAISNGRPQPVFTLLATSLTDTLTAFVHHGGRKIMAWYDELNCSAVDFGDDESLFANINTHADLAAAAEQLCGS